MPRRSKFSYDLAQAKLQRMGIEAYTRQKNALQLTRLAFLDEVGAFTLRESANNLRRAADLLEAISDQVLMGLPMYGPRAWLRKVESKTHRAPKPRQRGRPPTGEPTYWAASKSPR